MVVTQCYFNPEPFWENSNQKKGIFQEYWNCEFKAKKMAMVLMPWRVGTLVEFQAKSKKKKSSQWFVYNIFQVAVPQFYFNPEPFWEIKQNLIELIRSAYTIQVLT